MTTETQDLPRTNRASLVHNEFLSEYDGRLKAGTVVLVDDRTYRRWLDKGIARPAAETDKTLLEQKTAELERLHAEIAEIGGGAPVAESVSRDGGVENQRAVRRTGRE